MKRNAALLFILALAAFESPGHLRNANELKQTRSSKSASNNDAPVFYVSRVVSVSSANRDSYVACLQERVLPIWRKLKRDGSDGCERI
jgi:hypothetical protein